jgi:hypothetical protein
MKRRIRQTAKPIAETDTTYIDILNQPSLLIRMNQTIGPLVADLALLMPRHTSLGLIKHRLATPVGDMAICAAAELSDEDLIMLMS